MKKQTSNSQSNKPTAEELQEIQRRQQQQRQQQQQQRENSENDNVTSSQVNLDYQYRRTNDNDNRGLGIARRPTQSPSTPRLYNRTRLVTQSPSTPLLSNRTRLTTQSPSTPLLSNRTRLVNDSDLIKKPKKLQHRQRSASDDQSTETGQTGSVSQMSTGTSVVTHQRQMISQPPTRSFRTQERHFQRQIQLLASISGASVVVFLFFFLNFFALLTLILGLSSTSMLFYTSHSYISYVLNSGEGAFFSYLPASIQNYLSTTSLHAAMTDDSNFLENRWYLLYFIPGLTHAQIDGMVARLPQRHRDMAYGTGGMARLFLPENVWRLIAPPNGREDRVEHVYDGSQDGGRGNMTGRPRLTMTGESGHVMRIMDGQAPEPLPVIEEDIEDEYGVLDVDSTLEEEITMQDAFQGIFQNTRTLIGRSGGVAVREESGQVMLDIMEEDISRDIMSPLEATRESYQDMSWDESYEDELQDRRIEVHVVDDSDSETSDLGLDVSTDDFTGRMNDTQLNRLGRMLRLLPSRDSAATQSTSYPPSRAIRNRPPITVMALPDVETEHSLSDLPNVSLREDVDDDERTLEEQQELEGDIIIEAISIMVDNFSTSANNAVSSTITNAAASVIESVTPSIISVGTRLSSIAGVGLIGLFTSSHMQPINVLGRSVGGGGRRLGQERSERYLITGLVSTLAMGAFSVGGAYVSRFLMRRHIAANRALTEGSLDDTKDNTHS